MVAFTSGFGGGVDDDNMITMYDDNSIHSCFSCAVTEATVTS
jgi:hypothetical protein